MHIIGPEQFKTTRWKNGKGETTELAISAQSSLNNFDWRLSIASVVEDGVFSDFSGVERHLVLIEGKGLDLQHDNDTSHSLNNLLDFAEFSGASQTTSQLHDGPILDFNLMTRDGVYQVDFYTLIPQQRTELSAAQLTFAYSLSDGGQVQEHGSDRVWPLPKAQLLQHEGNGSQGLSITAEQVIIIQLNPLQH